MGKKKFRGYSPHNAGGRIANPPHSHTGGSDGNKHPLFGFKYLDKKFGINQCEKQDRAALAKTLHKLGCMTWKELRMSDHHACGYEQIPESKLNGGRRPSGITDDMLIIVFRFSGMKPMIGFKDGDVFQLWKLDPKFKAYKHGS